MQILVDHVQYQSVQLRYEVCIFRHEYQFPSSSNPQPRGGHPGVLRQPHAARRHGLVQARQQGRSFEAGEAGAPGHHSPSLLNHCNLLVDPTHAPNVFKSTFTLPHTRNTLSHTQVDHVLNDVAAARTRQGEANLRLDECSGRVEVIRDRLSGLEVKLGVSASGDGVSASGDGVSLSHHIINDLPVPLSSLRYPVSPPSPLTLFRESLDGVSHLACLGSLSLFLRPLLL